MVSQETKNNEYKVQWKCCKVLKSNLLLKLKEKFETREKVCCLRMTPSDRIFVDGYSLLEKEIHIANVLKKIRVMKGILKRQNKKEWKAAYAKYSVKNAELTASSDDEKENE